MGEKVRRGQLSYWVSLCDATETGDAKLQRNSSALESLPYFCTTANLKSAVVYLSQELQGMGLSCPLIETASQRVNLVALVNACWEVTQLYRTSVRDSNTLHDQRRRDVADINHFQNNIRDLRGSVEEKERLVCDAQEKERQAISVSKALASKLKAEKEEVRKLGSVLQQREAHHQHELRKKETESNRLRERLHRLVSTERNLESRPPGMTISSTLARSNRSRAKWKTEASNARHEEDLHRRVLSQYEAWVGQLNDENDQLKSCLSSFSSQISKLVSKYSKNDNQFTTEGDMNSSLTSSMFSADSLDDPIFSLEFSAFRDQVQQAFDDHIKAIVQMLEEKSRKDNENIEEQLRKEISDLQKQLTEAKDQLTSYQQLLTKGENEENKEKDLTFALDSGYVEERAGLEKVKQEIASEKKLLLKERESFTEAAVRLNRERAAFEAEKVELLKQQFLQELPPTLKDVSADTTASGHESGGSLSSGSIGEVFDSPQRIVALPNITSPRGNITFVQGSPIVLGPTVLPKQKHETCFEGSSRKASICHLKSAPVSRASSVPRLNKGLEEQYLSDKGSSSVRPPISRPHTLERARRRPHSGMATPVYRSRSQSRGDLTANIEQVSSRADSSHIPSRTMCTARKKFQDHKHPAHISSKEGLKALPTGYQEGLACLARDSRTSKAARRLVMPVSNSSERYSQEDQYDDDHKSIDISVEDYDVEVNRSLHTLETDLINLMAQIDQWHGEPSSDSCVDNPPPYEEITQQKPYSRNVHSFLSSAPGSLSGSRRSSRDLNTVGNFSKGMHKPMSKNSNQL
ncbi:afadin- and alpha-actinin-binding protein B-like isoform X2 [Panulirus ornatus]